MTDSRIPKENTDDNKNLSSIQKTWGESVQPQWNLMRESVINEAIQLLSNEQQISFEKLYDFFVEKRADMAEKLAPNKIDGDLLSFKIKNRLLPYEIATTPIRPTTGPYKDYYEYLNNRFYEHNMIKHSSNANSTSESINIGYNKIDYSHIMKEYKREECGMIKMTVNPLQFEGLNDLLNNKPAYIFFNQEIYYASRDSALIKLDRINTDEIDLGGLQADQLYALDKKDAWLEYITSITGHHHGTCEGITITHTPPYNLPAIFKKLSDLYAQLNILTSDQLAEKIEITKEMTWHLSHAMPQRRGSAAICEMLLDTILKYNNIPYQSYVSSTHPPVDLIAIFSATPAEFSKNFIINQSIELSHGINSKKDQSKISPSSSQLFYHPHTEKSVDKALEVKLKTQENSENVDIEHHQSRKI